MTVVLEDGTPVVDSNSYNTVEMVVAYAEMHGLSFDDSDTDLAEQAAIRGSQAIDIQYGPSFPGYRVAGRQQGMEWPRAAAYDAEGWLIDAGEVPKEVLDAACEAAIRELAVPGSMQPDLKRGGAIQSVRAGSVAVTYAANASSMTTFSVIDKLMSNILTGTKSSGGGLFGQAVRG